MNRPISTYKRVQQWAVFGRLWFLFDAKWQNPFDSAEKIAKYLAGKHKPIYHPLSDVGDHVVVINTKDIALPNKEWRYRMYYHHTGFAGGSSWTSAWELHNKDQTKVLWKAVYKACGGSLLRHNMMERLHLFPDDKIPQELMENISDHMKQLRPVPKALHEYTEEEIKNFPKVFEWPEDYVLN
ncbi:39S ribosomal protein L13, mitochondrial-like [Limulus polyphemus]|uniref:39S ribosomal protein L13, mitochondrial-like n=1 Tax=Limulus polyphemus TaxID=6850 RepID=A0ABM1BU55_LIMPO|nr:39S ribosomal protein L13, mitochondrial-like [Limulus polyphemus]